MITIEYARQQKNVRKKKQKLYGDIKNYDPILPTMKPNQERERDEDSREKKQRLHTPRIKNEVEKLSSRLHKNKCLFDARDII